MFAGQDGFEYRRRDIDLWNSLYEQVNVKWSLERGERHSVANGHFYTATTAEVEMLQKMRDSLNMEIRTKTKELNKLNDEFAMADRRVKGLSTMLANMENKKAEIESEISSLESQAHKDGSLDDIQQRKEELLKALPDILEKLKQRQKRVAAARRELQEVASRRRQVEEVIVMLKKSNRFRPNSLHEKTLMAMQNTIWKELLNHGKELHSAVLAAADEFNNIVRTTRYRDPIEESDIELLVNNGSLLVEIATAIYVGDLWTANKLAEENGLRPTKLERGEYFDNGEFLEKCWNEALSMAKKE